MIDLSLFQNPQKDIYTLRKWNWDYLEAQAFQIECLEFVSQNPHISIFLICSHPNCFTIGRGLQKLKENAGFHLIDFDNSTKLAYPLHQIKRGGGLTFHYSGQLVFYPIINLNYHKLVVHDFMLKILEITKALLERRFGLYGLTIKKDLFGLWFENEINKLKIASIGLALSRFTTYHGMALNFFEDQTMFEALLDIFPCGLPGSIYSDVETLVRTNFSNGNREEFANDFMEIVINSFSERPIEISIR